MLVLIRHLPKRFKRNFYSTFPVETVLGLVNIQTEERPSYVPVVGEATKTILNYIWDHATVCELWKR